LPPLLTHSAPSGGARPGRRPGHAGWRRRAAPATGRGEWRRPLPEERERKSSGGCCPLLSGHGLALPGRGQASPGRAARGPEGRRQRQRRPQRRPAWPPKEGRGKRKGGLLPPLSQHTAWLSQAVASQAWPRLRGQGSHRRRRPGRRRSPPKKGVAHGHPKEKGGESEVVVEILKVVKVEEDGRSLGVVARRRWPPEVVAGAPKGGPVGCWPSLGEEEEKRK